MEYSSEKINNNEISSSKLLEELETLELELMNEEKIENDFGFVFVKGGGSRPKPSSEDF